MGRKSTKLSAIFLAFLVFATNLTFVEDLLSEETCNWICQSESGDITTKELQEMISQGKVMKLKFVYKERVERTCANQTDAHNTSASAELWFVKMASNNKPSIGVIRFLSQTILEGIYSGQFVFGDYKEMNVSCIYRSTTKPRTNHSWRLAFHTPLSVMYYVEHLANYTERNATFLTLIRIEKQIRITVGVPITAQNSSIAPAKDNELIVSDAWLFVSVVIWIGVALCSPVVFLLCRPSEVIAVQLVETTREEREDESLLNTENYDDRVSLSSCSDREERDQDERLTLPTQESVLDVNAEEHDEVVTEEVPEDEESTPIYISMEAQANKTGDSEMVGAPRHTFSTYTYKTGKNILRDRLPNKKSEDQEQNVHKGEIRGSNVTQPCCGVTKGSRELVTHEIGSIGSMAAYAEPLAEPFDVDGIDVGLSSDKTAASNDKEIISICNVGTSEAALTNRNDGEHTNNHAVVNITEPPNHSSNTQEIVYREAEENCNQMIIVGGPCPVAIGSCIGNFLFLGTKRNAFHRTVLFIFISFLPLMFLGFGDCFLLLLPSLHSQIASYLPYPYLTTSLVNFLINYQPVLEIFFFICYCTRFLYVFGFISSNHIESITWKPCFVHRRHFECFVYGHIQSILSEFSLELPNSFCNWRSRCRRNHRLCIILHCFCTSLHPCGDCNSYPPVCPKDLEVPENILHNLKNLPDVFIKHYNVLVECFSKSFETKQIAWIVKAILSPLVVVPLCLDIFLSSPLVCLCHGRMWISYNEIFKTKFRVRYFILRFLEILFTVFSLVWLSFFFSMCAVIMEFAFIGLMNSIKLLPHVTIVGIFFHYFWSCYKCFTMPYTDLAKKIFETYRKKFDELEKKGGVNVLINYEQGDHVKLIPKGLFNYACEHRLINMPVRVKVFILLRKSVLTLLLFSFVFPFIRAPSSEAQIILSLIAFLTVYSKLNDAINAKSELSQGDVDRVVDDYIKSLSQK